MTLRPLRVIVVDDSESTRATIAEILGAAPDVEVVLSTGDGEEALRRAINDPPDVVCLDLEMPRMDGFTFLRLLMARRPTPVIVVSSSTRKGDAFKALELGALDFVAKPERNPSDVSTIRGDLLAKIATVRALRLGNLEPTEAARAAVKRLVASAAEPAQPLAPTITPASAGAGRLVVVGASTGGPSAIAKLLGILPPHLPVGFAIAQHMPEKFTRAFAERLDRATRFEVREAEDGDALLVGRVLLAPGGRHLKLVRAGGTRAGALRAIVVEPRAGDPRYRPSVDLLFQSAAETCGREVCAVVLTGMGNDGRAGVVAVKDAGGLTLAESEATAVVYGMPKEAVESGKVDAELPLEAIAQRIVEFAGVRR